MLKQDIESSQRIIVEKGKDSKNDRTRHRRTKTPMRMKMKGARNQPFKTVGINSVLESLMTMWKSDGLENVAKATLRKRSRETGNDEEEITQLAKSPKTRAMAAIPALQIIEPFKEKESVTFNDVIKAKFNGIEKIAPKLSEAPSVGKDMHIYANKSNF